MISEFEFHLYSINNNVNKTTPKSQLLFTPLSSWKKNKTKNQMLLLLFNKNDALLNNEIIKKMHRHDYFETYK